METIINILIIILALTSPGWIVLAVIQAHKLLDKKKTN